MSITEMQALLSFFKGLANENRLKILGVLASRECSVDELAVLLDLKAPTITHHLSILKELGLVDMRKDGNDHLHKLNSEGIEEMSKRVFLSLNPAKVTNLGNEVEYEAWERKVLHVCLDKGRIWRVPRGYKKRLVVLKWLINKFEDGVTYTETEVNEIINRYYHDHCLVRREFIEHGFMERDQGTYWRIDWAMPDLS